MPITAKIFLSGPSALRLNAIITTSANISPKRANSYSVAVTAALANYIDLATAKTKAKIALAPPYKKSVVSIPATPLVTIAIPIVTKIAIV